jgi:PKD repeat protein
VQVNGSSRVGLTAPLASYRWTCGNGTTLTTASGTCTYTTAGTFTPVLTVTDTAGRSDTWSGTVTVTADAPPLAALKATPSSGYVPLTVVLDASASTDTDSTPIASFTFNCGNGQTGAAQPGATFTCSYPKSGTFTASVVVRDTAGLSATRSVTVKVQADAAPNAVLTLSDTQISRGGSVVADGSASTDVDNTPIASYRFDCGNGVRTAEQSSPTTTCTYSTTGKFTIQLWVTDTAQLTRSTTKSVRVR